MIHKIPEPKTSPDFTIEDIRKVRDWHYEILKDATFEEMRDFYRKGAAEGEKRIQELRRQKGLRVQAQ